MIVDRTGNAAVAGTTTSNAPFSIQPRLYLLAIGISAYIDRDIPPRELAAKETQALAASFQRQQGAVYRSVDAKVLIDGQASKEAMLDGLDWLQRSTTQHDIAVLFLSGYGLDDAVLGHVFLPVDADPARLKRTAVTPRDLGSTLNAMPGITIAFIDSCQHLPSAAAGPGGVVDGIELAGVHSAGPHHRVVLFEACGPAGRQSRSGHGIFAQAVIDGFEGAADTSQSGRVTLQLLEHYVIARASISTQGAEIPLVRDTATGDLLIALSSRRGRK